MRARSRAFLVDAHILGSAVAGGEDESLLSGELEGDAASCAERVRAAAAPSTDSGRVAAHPSPPTVDRWTALLSWRAAGGATWAHTFLMPTEHLPRATRAAERKHARRATLSALTSAAHGAQVRVVRRPAEATSSSDAERRVRPMVQCACV